MPADAPKRTLAGRLGLDATASVVFVEVPPALMRLIKPVHTSARQTPAPSNGIVWAVGGSAAIASHARDVAASYTRGDRLWVLYPKRTGRIRTDISRDNGWQPVLELGFVPVSQVAVDDDWSALRFRLADEVRSMTRKRAIGDGAPLPNERQSSE